MMRVAVFVDAGYLFAQGSAAISQGPKKRRESLLLNEAAAVKELSAAASSMTGGLSLLRIYWYDGARGGSKLPPDHAKLAHTDYVKLRLGFMNSQGQQKGVDSFIVTDLIELARNHAMSDAVLLSGDENVRIGVQIAQSFGVRVHLIGIAPCRGSQSLQLMQEADTTTEWDATVVSRFLTVLPSFVSSPSPTDSQDASTVAFTGSPSAVSAGLADLPVAVNAPFENAIVSLLSSLDPTVINGIFKFWSAGKSGLPRDIEGKPIDGRLLAMCRAEIDRDLLIAEKKDVRVRFSSKVRAQYPRES